MTTRRRFFRSTLGALVAAPFAALHLNREPVELGPVQVESTPFEIDIDKLSCLVADGIRDALGPPDLVA